MNISDFDQWRNDYDKSSYADQLTFYNQVEVDHPLQKGFDIEAFIRFFDYVLFDSEPITVIELGGWKGELATEMLAKFCNIRRWLNYEISQEAVNKSVCTDERYEAIVPADFAWNIELAKSDVFVSSHTIEHIKADQLYKLFDKLQGKYIGLQAPLADGPTCWTRYYGSHILEVGWEDITQKLNDCDYQPIFQQGEFRGFER